MAQFRNLTARDIMVRKVFVLRPQMEACQAIRTMLKHKIAGAPVVDTEGRYLGMFSEKHSLSLLLDIEYESIPTSEIGSFMDRKARVVYEDTDVLSIVDIFLNEPYRRLPVLRGENELVGLVCRRDVVKAFYSSIVNRQKVSQESAILYFSSVSERSESPIAT